MFKIKSLEFKNLLSYGNKPVEIDFTSISSLLIYGTNGSGKSTIFTDALHFALFGKPYRKIPMDELINKVNRKGLYTKIIFENNNIEFTIERGISPKLFKVFKNNVEIKETEEVKKSVSKIEFQKYVNDTIIGIDSKIFNQISIVDSSFYKPFMKLTPEERRYTIDRIFGLDVVTSMAVKAKEYKTKIENKIITTTRDIELLDEKINFVKVYNENNRNKQIEETTKKIEEQQSIVDENKSIINKTKIELEQIDKTFKIQKETINNIEKLKKQIEDELPEKKYKIRENNTRIELLKLGKCDKCRNVFDKNETEKEINILTNENDIVKKEIEQINIKIKEQEIELNKNKKDNELLNTDINTKNTEIYSLEKTNNNILSDIIGYRKRILNLQQQNNEQTEDIVELEKEKAELQEIVNKDKSMFSNIKITLELMDDDHIRSYILKKYLPVFNSILKKYLEIMESNFSFEFNEMFEQVVNSKIRQKMISFDGFSSGQKARVNLAVLFSLIEFAERKSNTRFDFLVLDELLDSSNLDVQGKDALLTILRTHINKKLIVISHDSGIQNNFDKAWEVQLKGNYSTLEMN